MFLTNAPMDKPLQPFDDDDDRRLIENCYIKELKQPWSLQHPPQKTARAVHVHVLFTWLMFALTTAYRLQAAPDDLGQEPVGWQRWRRQLLAKPRDHVIVFARDCYGIFQRVESSLVLGAGSRMGRLASARPRTFSRNIGARRMANLIFESQCGGEFGVDIRPVFV